MTKGVVIGVLVVAIVLVLVWWLWQRSNKKKAASSSHNPFSALDFFGGQGEAPRYGELPRHVIDDAFITFAPYREEPDGAAQPNAWRMYVTLAGAVPPENVKGIQLSLARENGDPLYAGPGSPCQYVTRDLLFDSPSCDLRNNLMSCHLDKDPFILAASAPPSLKDNPCSIVSLEGMTSQVTYGDNIRVEAILLDSQDMPIPGTERSFATKVPSRND